MRTPYGIDDSGGQCVHMNVSRCCVPPGGHERSQLHWRELPTASFSLSAAGHRPSALPVPGARCLHAIRQRDRATPSPPRRLASGQHVGRSLCRSHSRLPPQRILVAPRRSRSRSRPSALHLCGKPLWREGKSQPGHQLLYLLKAHFSELLRECSLTHLKKRSSWLRP